MLFFICLSIHLLSVFSPVYPFVFCLCPSTCIYLWMCLSFRLSVPPSICDFLCLSVFQSVFMCVCPSVCVFLRPSGICTCFNVCLSFYCCPSISWLIHLSVNLYACFSSNLCISLFVHLSVSMCTYLSVCQCAWVCICLTVALPSVCAFIYLSCHFVHLSVHPMSVYLPCPPICPSFHQSVYLFVWIYDCPSICLFVHPSMSLYMLLCLSIHFYISVFRPSIHLSARRSVNPSVRPSACFTGLPWLIHSFFRLYVDPSLTLKLNYWFQTLRAYSAGFIFQYKISHF